LFDDPYRENAKIGRGSTADAVRHELSTGQSVGGKTYSQKAEDYSRALQDWIKRNPMAPSGDRAAAENVLKDLQNALKGKYKCLIILISQINLRYYLLLLKVK
jgi:hypothetical protein